MAVYTPVSPDELTSFLGLYEVGTVRSFEAIAEGVENSNYLLKTDRGAFILTLYEKRVAADDLPYFLSLMDFFADKGAKCARPIKTMQGTVLGELCNRPAALIEFLDGASVTPPSLVQARAAGAALAQLHVAGASFPQTRTNDLGPAAWAELLDASALRAGEVEVDLGELLDVAVRETVAAWPQDLPSGVIHADLFPDNVLFVGNEVSGIIDFYFACTDSFAYDLAIMINAWCFTPKGDFEKDKSAAIVAGYTNVRPLSAKERTALPILARGAAIRFILTRLNDWLNNDPKALVTPKDPRALLPHLAFHGKANNPSVYGA